MLQRTIPSTGEQLPVIGLGTWQTFNISNHTQLESLTAVLQVMQQAGGRIIDSSPMYGTAEKAIGDLTGESSLRDSFFYATKVFTEGKEAGIRQMQASFQKMKRKTMDLMQVHNLVDWRTHLNTLKEWKQAGKIRYIGITHYTHLFHNELERILSSEDIDFVQFNYSIFSRNAEKRLLNAAAKRGVATLINRPFDEGAAFAKIKRKQLPVWAHEYGINSWSQFLLLFIISHPAVTAVIPATGNPVHAKENFDLPIVDNLMMGELRKKMEAFANEL